MKRNTVQTQCDASTFHLTPFWGAAINKKIMNWEEQVKRHNGIKSVYVNGTSKEMLSESMARFGAASQSEWAETVKFFA